MRARGTAVATVVCVGLLAGCERADVVAPPRPSSALSVDSLVHARALVRRGDHAHAIPLLEQAIQASPESLEVHYLLAVSHSHLDQTDRARREFEWVAGHSQPDSPEATIAREWLVTRASVVSATAPESEGVESSDRLPTTSDPDLATLSGKVEDARGPRRRLLLFLKGVRGSPAQDEYRTLRTDGQGRFQFTDLKPGDYLLLDAVAGPVTWRLHVSLAPAERRNLDLSRANDTTARDDAPERR